MTCTYKWTLILYFQNSTKKGLHYLQLVPWSIDLDRIMKVFTKGFKYLEHNFAYLYRLSTALTDPPYGVSVSVVQFPSVQNWQVLLLLRYLQRPSVPFKTGFDRTSSWIASRLSRLRDMMLLCITNFFLFPCVVVFWVHVPVCILKHDLRRSRTNFKLYSSNTRWSRESLPRILEVQLHCRPFLLRNISRPKMCIVALCGPCAGKRNLNTISGIVICYRRSIWSNRL